MSVYRCKMLIMQVALCILLASCNCMLSVNVLSRRMSDPATTTWLGAPPSPYSSWTVWDRAAHSNRKRSKYRRPRKTKKDESLTFSSLFNLKGEVPVYTKTRYPRLTAYLQRQQSILANIHDKLDLLNMACSIQPCSHRLRRVIALAMQRRAG